MKRFKIWNIVLTVILILAVSAPAYAGVLGKIGGWFSGQALTLLFTGFIALLGSFGVAYKLWGVAAKELFEFVKAVMTAIDPDGPDGRKINEKEMEKIIKEGQELYPAVAKAVAASRKK